MTTPEQLPPLASATDYTALVGPAPAGLDLDRLLAAASDMVRKECGWHIAPPASETFVVDGPGGRTAMLPTLELTDVVTVTDAGTVVDPLDLEWSRDGYLRRCGCWTTKLRGLSVTATHGYADVPVDLIALVCTVAARAAASPAGAVREQVGSASVTYSQVGFNVSGGTALLKHEIEYLAKYKLPSRP